MLFGSHLDRPVRLAVRDGREVVVKTYRRGGCRQVHDEMLALWRSPFGRERRPPGLPEPLDVNPATGEVVMARVPGRPLAARGDLGDSVLRLPEVAVLLADLHTSGVTFMRVRSSRRVLASSRRKATDLRADSLGQAAGSASVAVAAAATSIVEQLDRCCPTQEALVPSHGDFSPRNVLGDVAGVVLIDLDRMQMADPAHDLAYWGAWAWATQAMNDLTPTWEVLGDLVSQYTGHLGDLSPAVGENLAFHQGAALVRIVHGWSTLADTPSVQLVLLAAAARLLDPCAT